MTVIPTYHAMVRQAQRNLSADDIEFVLVHGRRFHAAGALHVFLAKRDIPRDADTARRYARLEGTTLVLSSESEEVVLVTAYRNRHAMRGLRSRAGSRSLCLNR
ncbi:MAG: hypothetical protein Fur005_27090 [Roseiflexaceae bacterium]|jgi:hypothetical protein